MTKSMRGVAGDIAADHPGTWKSYSALVKATADCGPLTECERRLVKLVLEIGAGSESAMRSHTRRGRAEAIAAGDMAQVAMLAIGPLGLPSTARRVWECMRPRRGSRISTRDP